MARDDRDRLAKLVAAGSATQADLDRASSKVSALEAQLAAQDAQRRSLKIDLLAKASGSTAAVGELAAKLADSDVRSPLDGVVLQRFIELGEVVPVNGALFKVGNVDDLVLECSVDEADIGRVTVGKKAAVALYAFPKQAFHGAVVQVLPDADREKKAFLVKVKLDDAPSGMRSGMTAEVNLVVDEHPGALLAPAEAIDAQGYAWVVKDGRVHKVQVKTGVRDMLRVEVLAGLNEGDHLVVTGGDVLAENARVAETFGAQSKDTPQPKASTGGGGGLAP
jgi:RND family efflux transporter MFP subunit